MHCLLHCFLDYRELTEILKVGCEVSPIRRSR